MSGLRTSQVAEAAGVNLQTLRYYERRGLIAEPNRTLGGHRVYPTETVTVLRVIKAAQRLGFTLDEVADLLHTGRHRHGHPDDGLQARAQLKLIEIEQRIADLEIIRATLRDAVSAGCDDLMECAAQPDCPLPFAELARPDRKKTVPPAGSPKDGTTHEQRFSWGTLIIESVVQMPGAGGRRD